MKKVLFITYYWPPSGKASLHWPLKIIKYLPQFGWQPVVLTVEEDTFSAKDESLLKEIDNNLKVFKIKSFEPFDLYKKFTGKKKDEQLIASDTISTVNKSLTHRISIWIRMNLFIPDARVGWYFNAVNQGKKILQKEKIDAIVSIGPPHTTHLIGMTLSKQIHVPHIPVFIDPWVDIIYYKNFKRSKLTLLIDNYLERKVLSNSKAAVFVTKTMQTDYIKKYPFLRDKSNVCYWGYNEEDFENITSSNPKEEIIIHAGNIFDYQNPKVFWVRVKDEIDRGRNIKIKFIGTVSNGIKQSIAESGLTSRTEFLGFLHYKVMLEELSRASYLLVCATEPRHVPGKLFEYLRIGKPIIAFGNDNNEVKNILKKTNAGMMFRYSDDGGEFFNNAHSFKTDLTAVKLFDRKNIAASLSKILDPFWKK
ncbi:MAG: glycosyltransferase [Ignavibacteriaceae bacterium]